jgi:hypothetical protein
MWASIAINFHLLAIQCLTDQLSDLSNRLCHMSLYMFYFDLLRQYVNGRTFSPTSKLYVEAAKHLNFHLLARPSQQMSVFLQCSPVHLAPIKDSMFSSANYYASVSFIKTYNISLFHVQHVVIYFFFKHNKRFGGKSTFLLLNQVAIIHSAFIAQKILFMF